MRAAPLLILACAIGATVSAQPQRAPIAWRHSLSEGLQDANGKRMLFVFVGTTWDSWTANAKSRLDGDSGDRFTALARKELIENYIPVNVDASSEEGKRLCTQYKIKSFPMFLYFSADGELIMKRAGLGQGRDFPDRLILARQHALVIVHAQQRLRRNANDPLGLELLAMSYAKRWLPEQAKPLLARAARQDPHNDAGELAVAYNSLGDYYQQRSEFTTAIHLFQRGAAVAKNTDEKAYSLYSISSCYSTMGGEPEQVRKYAQAVLDLPNLSPDDRRIGERLLGRPGTVARQGSRGAGIRQGGAVSR